MKCNMATSDYRTHDIRLRDIRNGELVVSYNAINDANSSYTEARHVSARLPFECVALFNDGRIDVGDLTDEERQWLHAESAARSNAIDFQGTEAGA